VDLVAGAVEEAGVDEDQPLARRADAFLEVQRGAPLLVHDADLEGIARQVEDVLDACEQLGGERDFVRTVLFRLDDVYAAVAAVAQRADAFQVMQGAMAGDQAVEQALEHLVAVLVQHRVGGHQVADVAHQHQAAAGDLEIAALGRQITTIRVEGSGQSLAALLEAAGEIAFHQPQPVAIDADLVLGVDCGDRVLTVHDGAERGLQIDVADAGGVQFADGVVGVETYLEMQAMVQKKQGRDPAILFQVAPELGGIAQSDAGAAGQRHRELALLHRIGDGIDIAAFAQGCGFVEESLGRGDDPGAAQRIETAFPSGTAFVGDDVGAVERIEQAAPAGVGGIQGIAGVVDRHHQLRTGDLGNLGIDVFGADGEVLALRQQIADLEQKFLIGCGIVRLVLVRQMPGIDAGLQFVAPGQQGAIARSQFAHDGGEALPQPVAADAGSG
jgi:hypothetical protein